MRCYWKTAAMNGFPGAPRGERKGFTLIELLIVMSVIAVLAAILLPCLSRVRGHARQTQCLSNLKQLGIAFHNYANTHRDLLPHKDAGSGGSPPENCDWYGALDPYLATSTSHTEVKQCPEFTGDITTKHSLKMNYYLEDDDKPFYKIGRLHESNLVLLMDARTDSTVGAQLCGTRTFVAGRHLAPRNGPFVFLASFVLVDGSARALQGVFEPNAGGTAWQWANDGPYLWEPEDA